MNYPIGNSTYHLKDPYGRKLNCLRIAVTDRCNLRCVYCMPSKGIKLKSHDDILCFEEMERLVSIFVKLGVTKIRITGGEPFIRKGIVPFLKKINIIDGISSINITTNAVLLTEYLPELINLKVKSLNISLDSLQNEKFLKISRRDNFEKTLTGIKMAINSPISVKLNMVVLAGINDDEIFDFIKFAQDHPVEVRFIEQMPFNGGGCPG